MKYRIIYCVVSNVLGTFAQSSSESEYNSVMNTGMSLVHSRILKDELLNKNKYVVPEQLPLIISYINQLYLCPILVRTPNTLYTFP